MEKDISDLNIMKVCRLCLEKNDLIWIFDKTFEYPEDMTDVILVTTGVTVTLADEVSQMLCRKCFHITINMFKFRSSSIVNDIELKARAAKIKSRRHPSVEKALSIYPHIILPPSITTDNIDPRVKICKDDVRDYMNISQDASFDTFADGNRSSRLDDDGKKDCRVRKKLPVIVLRKEANHNAEDGNSEYPKFQILSPKSETVLQEHTFTEENCHRSNEFKYLKNDLNCQHPMAYSSSNCLDHCDEDGISLKRKRSPTVVENSQNKKIKSFDVAGDNDLVKLVSVTSSLYICDICNNIFHTSKSLKKHKTNHMRCKLCKKRFRTLEETNVHVTTGCDIKHIMNNLPIIPIRRCDEMQHLRDQYPAAFGLDEEEINQSIEEVHTEGSATKNDEEEAANDEEKPTTDIVLISDDEDEDSIGLGQPNDKQNHILTNRVNAVVAIKPDVEIKGANVYNVDWNNDDVSILKSLIKQMRSSTEASTQTLLPEEQKVKLIHDKDRLFEMTNFRSLLDYYRIPVNVTNASQYAMKISYDSSPLVKKDRSWSRIRRSSKKTPTINGQVDKETASSDQLIILDDCILEQSEKMVNISVSSNIKDRISRNSIVTQCSNSRISNNSPQSLSDKTSRDSHPTDKLGNNSTVSLLPNNTTSKNSTETLSSNDRTSTNVIVNSHPNDRIGKDSTETLSSVDKRNRNSIVTLHSNDKMAYNSRVSLCSNDKIRNNSSFSNDKLSNNSTDTPRSSDRTRRNSIVTLYSNDCMSNHSTTPPCTNDKTKNSMNDRTRTNLSNERNLTSLISGLVPEPSSVVNHQNSLNIPNSSGIIRTENPPPLRNNGTVVNGKIQMQANVKISNGGNGVSRKSYPYNTIPRNETSNNINAFPIIRVKDVSELR